MTFSHRIIGCWGALLWVERAVILSFLLRFLYPFYNSPLSYNKTGISMRQWKQAAELFDPQLMGGVDSFLYQPYLAFIRFITQDAAFAVNLATGALCALMPVGWWLAARLLMPARPAAITALCISLCPSFITIYAYFTSETLLLVLLGFASYFSVRHWHNLSAQDFLWAALFWIAAAFTRQLALPAMLMVLVVLAWRMGRVRPLLLPTLFFALLTCLSGWHSYQALHVFAPFGMPELNSIYARSGTAYIRYKLDDKENNNWFRSPGLSLRPLAPFSDWRTPVKDVFTDMYIGTRKGMTDWQRELDARPVTVESALRQIAHNSVTVLFAPSWPEVWPDYWQNDRNDRKPLDEAINDATRWLWAPLTLLLLLGLFAMRLSLLEQALISLPLVLMLLLCFQFSGVMEGRYRKPAEPFMILGAALLLTRSHRQEG